MKERLAGFLLVTALVPLALLGYLIIVFVGLFGRTDRVRAGVRALDHFVNASVFNGSAWESLSSHAWRSQDKTWAKAVIWLTSLFHKDHCRRANKREQRIFNYVMRKGLHLQTIGKPEEPPAPKEAAVE